MIRHIVLCRFSEGTSEAEIAGIWAALAALRDVVPGIVEMRFGANVSPEGLARGATHAFTVDFESAAARDGYLEHPAHRAAGERLVAAVEGDLEGLVVVDF
ncbi:MAG: Dabb family protein [Pseudomonadota bacterium]